MPFSKQIDGYPYIPYNQQILPAGLKHLIIRVIHDRGYRLSKDLFTTVRMKFIPPTLKLPVAI